ncbi:hypothetical protein BKA70DRAFT_1184927 [Coprinopsis sp. MPI-PUGE-AT-0042]|nr:hypothetical protein BKA70DRAFT_1184927 [Coprinopsis sp. MPI-PUGE-AT-0042]
MASSLPSKEEQESYGMLIAKTSLVVGVLGSVLLASQIYMVLYGLFVFCGTPKAQRAGRLRFVIVSGVIAIASSIDMVMDIGAELGVVLAGGPTGISYRDAYANYIASKKDYILSGDLLLIVAIVVGDTLMLWRCSVLWTDKRWVLLFPYLAFFGSIGARTIKHTSSLLSHTNVPSASNITYLALLQVERFPLQVQIRALVVSVSLSVSMNIMVTSLILFQLISTWRRASNSFPNTRRPRMYTDVLVLMIESAAPLAFFGICWTISTIVTILRPPQNLTERGRLRLFTAITNCVYFSFCSIAPQMIILRVTTGKTWKNTTESRDGGLECSQPIRFTIGQSETKTNAHDAADDV